LKVCGSEAGKVPSRRAPVLEKFRTTQLMRRMPAHEIAAGWEEIARDRFLRSFMACSCPKLRKH
jgi:hypothetical protein